MILLSQISFLDIYFHTGSKGQVPTRYIIKLWAKNLRSTVKRGHRHLSQWRHCLARFFSRPQSWWVFLLGVTSNWTGHFVKPEQANLKSEECTQTNPIDKLEDSHKTSDCVLIKWDVEWRVWQLCCKTWGMYATEEWPPFKLRYF